MALQRYQTGPNGFWGLVHNEFDRLSENDWPQHERTAPWAPAVDIREDGEAYSIQADVPGVNPADIDVSFEGGVLAIKGERKAETKSDDGNVHRVERRHGSFLRRFTLPDTADAERIEAKVEAGVLRVVIRKKAESQPRKITVQS